MYYRIVCRGAQWHLLIEDQPVGLLQSDNRSYLVNLACKVAADRGKSVHIFDTADQLQARLSFEGGVFAMQGTYDGELDLGSTTPGPDVQA